MQTLTEGPEATDASHLETLNDHDLADVVKRSLFETMAPEVDEWFRGPGIERYSGALRQLAASLNGQLNEYAETGPSERRDEQWRRKAGVVSIRVNAAIAGITPILKERHRAENEAIRDDGRAELKRRLTEHRQAIYAHREASRAADLEPEPHDLALWALIDRPAGAGNVVEAEEETVADIQ